MRMYVERYVPADAGPEELSKPAAEGLKGLIEVALEFSKMKELLGRDKPTVITVSLLKIIVINMLCILADDDRFILPPQSKHRHHCQCKNKWRPSNIVSEPGLLGKIELI